MKLFYLMVVLLAPQFLFANEKYNLLTYRDKCIEILASRFYQRNSPPFLSSGVGQRNLIPQTVILDISGLSFYRVINSWGKEKALSYSPAKSSGKYDLAFNKFSFDNNPVEFSLPIIPLRGCGANLKKITSKAFRIEYALNCEMMPRYKNMSEGEIVSKLLEQLDNDNYYNSQISKDPKDLPKDLKVEYIKVDYCN